jgi:hypothetical protein
VHGGGDELLRHDRRPLQTRVARGHDRAEEQGGKVYGGRRGCVSETGD